MPSRKERKSKITNDIYSRTIKVNGLDISYLAGGQGDPLIVVHGGGHGANAWLQNARELSRYYSVYIPDLPGFGHSQSKSDTFHLPEFVAFIDAFSQNLGLKRFHLIGHSIGGGIALHYAFQYPEKIKGLVLVSSWCLGKEAALWVRFLSAPALCKSLGEAALALQRAVKWLVSSVYAPCKFMNPVTRVKMNMGMSMTSLKGQTTVLLNQLSELMVQTLVVWGTRDRIVPVSHAYAAAEVIPDCQIHVFEGCGHSVYKQRTQEFSELMARFLG